MKTESETIKDTINKIIGTDKVILRPEVLAFAEAMELELRRHDEEKGRDGWKTASPETLCILLKSKLAPFIFEIFKNDEKFKGALDYKVISSDAIHCANFIMMIYDIAKQAEAE